MFAGKMFADRWRIAKITTSKNFVPHGTLQTVLIRDIDNTWSFFKKSRSRVTSPPVCMQTILAWRIWKNAKTKSFGDLFLYVCFKALFFRERLKLFVLAERIKTKLLFVSRFSHHQEHGLLVIRHFKKNKKGLTLLKESHFHGTGMLFFRNNLKSPDRKSSSCDYQNETLSDIL